MKTKTLSLSTVLGFLGLLLMIHTFNSYASSPTIVCNSAFGEKSLTIDEQSVSFQKEDEMGINRSISSSNDQAISTHKKSNGFTKTLYIDGSRHRIHVENVNEFSEANDYLSITSSKGHVMTYPLTCHSV